MKIDWISYWRKAAIKISKCIVKDSGLPEQSSQIVADTLPMFMESGHSSEARCQTNCLRLANGTDINKIRQEFFVVQKDQEVKLAIIILIILLGIAIITICLSANSYLQCQAEQRRRSQAT